MQTYEIPEARFDWFTKEIAKLNKKAVKLDCTPITINEIGTVIRKNDKGIIYKYVKVKVAGQAPKYNGWSFIATVQYLKDQTIIRTVPGEIVPEVFRKKGPECDHCKRIRHRRDTYIVRHANGEHKQVGRTCLKDFLGHTDPGVLATWAKILTGMADLAEEANLLPGGNEEWAYFSLRDYLAQVSAVIRIVGWTNRTKAIATGAQATADIAHQIMQPAQIDYIRKLAMEAIVSEEDIQLAIVAIEWAKELEDSNDYLHNIKTIAQAGMLNRRLLGYAASIIPSYVKQEEERQKGSKYVGTFRKRGEFTIYIDKIILREGQFGMTYIHKLHDSDGNRIVWFGSKSLRKEVDVAEAIQVKATVKEHSAYEGIDQTVLTRVKEVN